VCAGMRRIAKYLTGLSVADYQIPQTIAAVIDFAVDSYVARIEELQSRRPADDSPADPKTHVKELWLGCEIHKAVSVNRVYPLFAKAKNAWAFAKLFDGGAYKTVPFLDTYPWKAAVKGSYEYRVQQEAVQIGPDQSVTLPVFGTCFVTDNTCPTRSVKGDFGY